MTNLFLTGDIQVGKSTIVKKALEKINTSIGGFITKRVVNGTVTSHIARSLYENSEEYIIAKIDSSDWSKNIYEETFDQKLLSVLNNSLIDRELIVLDELGIMERNIKNFTSKINEILDSNTSVFGVLKDADCEFLNNIRDREDVSIIRITEDNRDKILEEVMNKLEEIGLDIKSDRDFSWDNERIDKYNEALDHPKSDYPIPFIKEIERHIGDLNGKTVLDIAAGTGAFSIPLMKKGGYITAVDSSFNMLDSLIHRAREQELDKIKAIISPFGKSDLESHDISIAAFSGSSIKSIENLKKMYNLTNEYAFIISSFENQNYNFRGNILKEMLNRKDEKNKSKKHTLSNTLKRLDCLGYKYEYKEIEYEFSQFFNTYNDALMFFQNRFSIREENEIEILKEFFNKFLTKEDNQYKFENIKKSWIVILDTRK